MHLTEFNIQSQRFGTKINNIDKESALYLAGLSNSQVFELFALSNRIRTDFRGNKVDLCSIVNAKSGACPEDCSFCAQSVYSSTETEIYPLLDKDKILGAAESAKENGAKRFCVVTSGKKPFDAEISDICNFISDISKLGLFPCATLGLLDNKVLKQLRDAGLHRYHHNLETSEAFFREICTTHTYREKIKTINSAKSLGLSICSGGIFGLGESWEDRIDMAFALREIGVDSIPINFFTPIRGTPLGDKNLLNPLEALKIIAIYRLILPQCEIRICGGRAATLRELHSYVFIAGADSLLIGNYLTTPGRNPRDDLQMIKDMGLEL
ncbi:MAG: biotin synthase BioB [Nitrospirae bacterium]|nr:biotin synthase BioB [Nitrospirota bacterium]